MLGLDAPASAPSHGAGGTSRASATVTVISLNPTPTFVAKKLALNFKSGLDSFSVDFHSADFAFAKKTMMVSALTTNANYAVFVGDAVIDKGVFVNGKSIGLGKIQWNIRTGDVKYSIRSNLQKAFAAFGAVNANVLVPKLVVPISISIRGNRYGNYFQFSYSAVRERRARASN